MKNNKLFNIKKKCFKNNTYQQILIDVLMVDFIIIQVEDLIMDL